MLKIKKRNRIQFQLQAPWIDWQSSKGGTRRGWLFHFWHDLTSGCELSVNDMDTGRTVMQYCQQYLLGGIDWKLSDVFSAIIILG